jgi:hypothetical protein
LNSLEHWQTREGQTAAAQYPFWRMVATALRSILEAKLRKFSPAAHGFDHRDEVLPAQNGFPRRHEGLVPVHQLGVSGQQE